MKAFITGIPDCGVRSYIERTAEIVMLNKKQLKIFDIGEMIPAYYEQRGLKRNMEKILDTDEDELISVVGGIYEKMKSECEKYENSIIKGHVYFKWKKLPRRGTRWGDIEMMKPDVFISYIDSPSKIKERLDENKQWKTQNLSVDEICDWQNNEIISLEGIAEIARNPSFIIPSGISETILYKHIFHPEMPKLYLSFPISHVKKDEKHFENVMRISSFLEDFFNITNPFGLEIKKEKRNDYLDSSIVFYCKRWAEQADITLQYVPSAEVFSEGTIAEGIKCSEKTRELWFFFPSKEIGQFEKYYADRKFSSTEELFEFVEKNFSRIKIER